MKNNIFFFFFLHLPLYGALVFRSVLTKGLRPLDPRPAGGRCRGRPRVHESVSLVNPSAITPLPPPGGLVVGPQAPSI